MVLIYTLQCFSGLKYWQKHTNQWGRLTPPLRYNMDQVPIPFLVNHDTTYMLDSYTNFHIKVHENINLKKWQFTMQIFMNSRKGELRDGYDDLFLHGKSLKITGLVLQSGFIGKLCFNVLPFQCLYGP